MVGSLDEALSFFPGPRANLRKERREEADIEFRKAQTEDLRQQKKQREIALFERGFDKEGKPIENSKYDLDSKKTELEIQELKAQLRMVKGQNSAQGSDKAETEFGATGDASVLQKAMNNDPALKEAKAAQGVQAVANIDFENDHEMLKRKGFSPFDYDTPEKQDIIKRSMYKQFNGKKWEPSLIQTDQIKNGYFRRVGKAEAEQAHNNAKAFKSLLAGPKTSGNTAEGHKHERIINKASEATNVPKDMIASVLNTEVGSVSDPEDITMNAQQLGEFLQQTEGDPQQALTLFAQSKNVENPQQFVAEAMENLQKGSNYYNPDKDIATLDLFNKFRRDKALAESGTTADLKERGMQATETGVTTSAANAETNRMNAITAQANVEVAKLKAETDAKTSSKTNTQKDLDASRIKADAYKAKYKGSDLSDKKTRASAMSDLIEIEKLSDKQLTAAQYKNIGELKRNIALVDRASSIDIGNLGPYDSMWAGLKNTLNDNNVSLEAKKAAYHTMRNAMRHVLFGGALQPAEMESFKRSFADNTDMQVKVLGSMQVILDQLKTNVDIAKDEMHPLSAELRLGSSKVDLDNISKRFDTIVRQFTGDLSKEEIDKINKKSISKEKADIIKSELR